MNAPNIRALLEKPRQSSGLASAPRSPAESRHVESPSEEVTEYEPYASGRIGNQPQLTLLFRKANGVERGFSYSFFYSIESANRSTGFVVDFTHAKVQVAGKNLQRLFRLICEHRVVEIVELGRSQWLEAAEQEPVVEQVEFLTE